MEPWAAILISGGTAASIAAAALVWNIRKQIRADRRTLRAERDQEVKWKAEVNADRGELSRIVRQRETEAEWRGRVDADRRNVKEFMKEIRAKLDQIFLRLPPATVAGESPLRLTELGSAISKELDATGWADQRATTVKEEVEGDDPYGIQKFCFEYADTDVFPRDLRRAIRKSAFQHGLDENQVRRVFAIELRDKLLELAGLEAPE